MKKIEKCHGRKEVFVLGKMVILMLCTIAACSVAQKDSGQNGPMAKVNQEKYPFHCGDALAISISPDSALFLTGQYPIDDDGCIDLPIVGRKPVTSMTQEELGNYIKNTYMQYLRFPSVRVQPLIRLELMGGFQRPGFYYVSPHASFWEVFRLAGTPIREDGIEKLKLKRSRIDIDFDPVLSIENAKSLRQMGIQSGDQIMVTARPLKTSWDYFKDDVLPILSLTLSVAATTATAYITYQTFNRGGH
jgi:protein involved in polysaccharide export with SLBB domain